MNDKQRNLVHTAVSRPTAAKGKLRALRVEILDDGSFELAQEFRGDNTRNGPQFIEPKRTGHSTKQDLMGALNDALGITGSGKKPPKSKEQAAEEGGAD